MFLHINELFTIVHIFFQESFYHDTVNYTCHNSIFIYLYFHKKALLTRFMNCYWFPEKKWKLFYLDTIKIVMIIIISIIYVQHVPSQTKNSGAFDWRFHDDRKNKINKTTSEKRFSPILKTISEGTKRQGEVKRKQIIFSVKFSCIRNSHPSHCGLRG